MAAHVAAESERFNCAKCPWGANARGKHCDESNPADFAKFVIEIGGRPFMASTSCFLPKITPASRALLRLHMHYRNGLLAQAGGISDQPALYVEAMELLERTFNDIELQRAKDQARRAARE